MSDNILETHVWVESSVSKEQILKRLNPERFYHSHQIDCEEAVECENVKCFSISIEVKEVDDSEESE